MKKNMILVGLLVLVGSTLGYCYVPSYTWHQKMTVEVEVDGQVYIGSSVVEMTVSGHPALLPEIGVRDLAIRGEAVMVGLPMNRSLFALLTYDAFLTGKVFHDLTGGVVSAPEKGWAREIRKVRETRALDQKDYPLLVTFTDLTDPTTVKQVDPGNLAATFGPGVSLKRITLEITDEPVTEGKIEQLLPCLRSGKDCVPLNRELPYGHPMSNILNNAFWRFK
ncbi:MAG: hypothetical protein H0X47_18690 [Nitrospirales bacterium]|nr:hypothetical protein [Nitrospirales bacterium]